MATTIQIKRSAGNSQPSAGSLQPGELAYSELSKKLFIGTNGANMQLIGGEDFTAKVTDMVANMHNYLPAASASQFGAIKIGTGLSIDVNGVVSTTGGSADALSEAEVDARVQLGLDSLVAGAPGTLDTLDEIAAALKDNAGIVDTLVSKSQNLADLENASVARGNLGLSPLATQSPSSVNITGGTINGVTIDCGTF